LPSPIQSATEPGKSSGQSRDAGEFFDFAKREGKPALAALIGNIFHIREDKNQLTFYFDRRNANLIPMIQSVQNLTILETLAERHFGKRFDLNFAIGNDPKVRKRKEKESKALDEVKANPKVQFLLDEFGGTIVKCQILDDN